ncbi:MAG: carboxypeptidase regulatory-like domain-containing protein, partial [Myxococcales bacterium]|nr:carboxypeptidase regulatory-like domain-containing protein [Myxococcales bacterium]
MSGLALAGRRLLLALLAALAFAGVALAGGDASAFTVNGKVKNQSNVGLADVGLTWRNDGTGQETTVTTNASGNYSASLVAATYTVTIVIPGGPTSTIPSVTITGATTRDFTIILTDQLPPITLSGRAYRDDVVAGSDYGVAKHLRIDIYNSDTGTYIASNSLFTDDNGDYSITWQPPIGETYGHWQIRAVTNGMTDRGTLPSGTVLVRQSVAVTDSFTLDFTIHSFTVSGTISRCGAGGSPIGAAGAGANVAWQYYRYQNYTGTWAVDPDDGTFSALILQGSSDPNYIAAGDLRLRVAVSGYCTPYADETSPVQTSGITIATDAHGSADYPDIVYDRCLEPVPLLKARIKDATGNPVGHVELEVFNGSNQAIVSGNTRYTENTWSTAQTTDGDLLRARYGSVCVGVVAGTTQVYFNSRTFTAVAPGLGYGGVDGVTPAGRWQIPTFTMPAGGLDLGDITIPTLYLEGTTNPPIPGAPLYLYRQSTSGDGYAVSTTDGEGHYRFAIVPSDAAALNYNPATVGFWYYLIKTPPFGSMCGAVPCVRAYEVLPVSDTSGYAQGATSSKTTIDWQPGAPLTGTWLDGDGNPADGLYLRFYRTEPGPVSWNAYYYPDRLTTYSTGDYDGGNDYDDAIDGQFELWVTPGDYTQIRVYSPGYTTWNPRTDAPHAPIGRNVQWLTNFNVPLAGATLPFDVAELAFGLKIRVLTNLGLGVVGAAVAFDGVQQTGTIFTYEGRADMYPYGGQAGTPVDPAYVWTAASGTYTVAVTPPAATGLAPLSVGEPVTVDKTATYVYVVENTNTPIILSKDVIAQTTSSLTVQFVADQLVDGELCCGPNAGAMNTCAATATMSQSHTLEVGGLSA